MHLKMSSVKRRAYSVGLNVLANHPLELWHGRVLDPIFQCERNYLSMP